MADGNIRLFRLFGFTVSLHPSWIIIAFLVTWSLAAGVFPYYYPGLSSGVYWAMGITAALGLFASIIFHEFAHSLVARRFGLPMRGITLFVFGGIAEMEEEPVNPGVEVAMAIAGPLASILIGALFLLTAGAAEWGVFAQGILMYLGTINWVLAVFNLLPAFPLDGGRVLRGALWAWRKDLRWATKIAASVATGFTWILIGLGVLYVFAGAIVAGMWWTLIALFLQSAANSAYQRVLMRRSFEGEKVRRFMVTTPVTVPEETSVRDLVENYIYHYHHKMLPVLHEGRLSGCVSTTDIRSLPQTEWQRRSVQDVMHPCSADNTISPDADAMQALAKMSRTNASKLMVVEEDRLVGVITLKDLIKVFSLKMELEDEARR